MTQPVSETPVADAAWHELERDLAPGGAAPMRVVIASDGSSTSEEALRLVGSLPFPAGSEIQVVTVLEPANWLAPASLLTSAQEWATRAGEFALQTLGRPGIQVERAAPTGSPPHEILKAAEQFRADLLVVGPRGHTGLGRFLLGSVARNVAKHAACPVLVAHAPQHGLRRVVVAVDESPHAVDVLRMAVQLPLPEEAELLVCHVVRPFNAYPVMGSEYVPDLEKMIEEVTAERCAHAEALVARLTERLERWGRHPSAVVRTGDPAGEILALAEERQADLIIVGSRGVSLIEGLLVGSVADRLLNASRVSLLLVHPRA